MVMMNIAFLCVNLVIFARLILSEDCPQPDSSNGPLQFTVPMKISDLPTINSYFSINCCVTGFTKIVWTYRNTSVDNWTTDIPKGYNLADLDMKIEFKSFQKINNGYYNCTAISANNNSISNVTFVVSHCSEDNPIIRITDYSRIDHFLENANGVLCCNFSMKIPLTSFSLVMMSWKYIYKNQSYVELARFKGDKSYQHSEKGRYLFSLNTTKIEDYCVKTVTKYICITLRNAQVTDSGYYNCSSRLAQQINNYQFNLQIIPASNSLEIYIYTLSVVCAISIVTLTIVWIFYYGIIRWCRILCHSNTEYHNIDVTILHDDQDKSSISTALLISDILSNKGISTYIYDRDKVYGVDTSKEYLSAMSDCHTILFLVTTRSCENESLIFCLQNSTKYNSKRIFTFLSSRKTILGSLIKNEKVHEILKSVSNYNIWKSKYSENCFMRRRLIDWIVSYLPYKSISEKK